MTERQDVIGTWVLVSWTSLKNEQPDGYPMGEDARGQIIYSAEGLMAASLMRADFKDNPPTTDANPDTCLAYGGNYRFEGDQVVHDVNFATLPHWIGQPLTRTMAWQDGNLLLKTAPEFSKSGNRYEHHLEWQRVAD